MAQKIRPCEDGSKQDPERNSADTVNSSTPAGATDLQTGINQPNVSNNSPANNTQPQSPPSGRETAPRFLSDSVPTPSIAEFEETLKRLVDRIAKILQAEKCVFMLHDAVAGTLYPTLPAIGIESSQFVNLERRVS